MPFFNKTTGDRNRNEQLTSTLLSLVGKPRGIGSYDLNRILLRDLSTHAQKHIRQNLKT